MGQFLRNYTHTDKTMKLIGLTAALFSGVAYSAFPSSPVGDFEWMAWKQTHSIKFPTRHEESRRYNIFSQNRSTITKWFVKEGDTIEEDDVLFEVATVKVDSEIPSPVDGVITKIFHPEDSLLPVGKLLAIIDLEGETDVPNNE